MPHRLFSGRLLRHVVSSGISPRNWHGEHYGNLKFVSSSPPDTELGNACLWRRTDLLIVTSGLTTSLLLETILLRLGRDRLPWVEAARTAAGMSIISMITMELAE